MEEFCETKKVGGRGTQGRQRAAQGEHCLLLLSLLLPLPQLLILPSIPPSSSPPRPTSSATWCTACCWCRWGGGRRTTGTTTGTSGSIWVARCSPTSSASSAGA
jgi:hypothetical protein